jgi:hypothetical protein
VPRFTHTAVALFASALYVGAAPAYAQVSGLQRPYKSLFGGGAADPDVRHSFDVSVSALAGYEDNAADGAGGVATSPLYQTGFYTGVNGFLNYAWQGERLQVGANVGADGRYYPDQKDFIGVNQFAAIGLTANIGESGRLSANQSVSYSPAYMYGVFSPLAVSTPGYAVGVGDPLGEEHVFIYDTSVTFARDLTRHSSVEVLGEARYSDYNEGASVGRDLFSYSVGGRYRRGITRYTSLRLGYVYRKADYGFVDDINRATIVHDIDVGVDYRRPLSLTRRTTLNFAVGSSIVSLPYTATGTTELQYRLVADVNLSHQMGRTWSTTITYNRGVGFAEAFAEPAFSNAVTGSISGFFNRRTDFNANGGFSIGDAGLTTSGGRGFKAYNASARLRYALASMWALFAEYSYYKHDLGTVLIVAEGVPQNLNRNSVHAGVTLWLPLLRRR